MALRDSYGNPVLRFRYWDGRVKAVRRLVEIGTHSQIRNDLGLAPWQEVDVSIAVFRLRELVALVPSRGQWVAVDSSPWRWTDADKAANLGRRLQRYGPAVFCEAIVRISLDISFETDRGVRDRRRRTLLQVAIRLGIHGSEDVLLALFNLFGTDEIAVDYLDSGSTALRSAGLTWMSLSDATITERQGNNATWGML